MDLYCQVCCPRAHNSPSWAAATQFDLIFLCFKRQRRVVLCPPGTLLPAPYSLLPTPYSLLPTNPSPDITGQ